MHFFKKVEKVTYCCLPLDSRAACHVDPLIPVFCGKNNNLKKLP